jgi:hypothetical protein
MTMTKSIIASLAACGNPAQKVSDSEFVDSVAEAIANGGQI